MSPSLGPINQNLLMTSDYFIVPMMPDYFSAMATDSLAAVLPKWSAWAGEAKKIRVLREAVYPFPDKTPKFLGMILQKFRPGRGKIPAAAFQNWIDQIEKGVEEKLLPVLRERDMLLPEKVNEKIGFQIGQPLLQMADFNSLIALSQKHKVPIFDLTDEQLERRGSVLEKTRKSMLRFRDLYDKGADRIIKLTEHA